MDKLELEELLLDAQVHLFDAIASIREYVNETDDQNAKAYLLDHLCIMASSEHEFLSCDLNIDDLIERVNES